MKPNSFKNLRLYGIPKTKINSLAGRNYTEKSDSIRKEIDFINQQNAKPAKGFKVSD